MSNGTPCKICGKPTKSYKDVCNYHFAKKYYLRSERNLVK